MASVCQIVYELAGMSEFRHGLPVRFHNDILTNLVRLLDHPTPAYGLCTPQARSEASSTASAVHAALLSDVCDAIGNVSREHKDAKKLIVDLGGIPALVKLLDSLDAKLQRAATSVLRTLAFKDEVAKQEIVDSGAMPPLIRMLRSEVRTCCRVGSH
jgi:Armadillo/beta-catenin-like repeat